MKRKQRIKELLFWLGVVIYFVITVATARHYRETMRYKSVEIIIADSAQHQFINKDDILDILANNKIKIEGQLLDSLNTLALEHLMKSNHVIKEIEVYHDYNGTLYIRFTQRNPIIRLLANDHSSFYLDEDGYDMEYLPKYITHVPIVTGVDINEKMIAENFNAQTGPFLMKRDSVLHDVFVLGSYIYNHPFWRHNIEQIDLREDEIVLIPLVGSFEIQFGNMSDYKKKFMYLETFYEKVLPRVGWQKYKVINLKYKNQIVCQKK